MTLLLALLLQFLPGLPDPDAPVAVGGVVEGPYLFREDEALTTKVVLRNGMTVIVRESNASTLTSLTLEARTGYLDEPSRSGLARIAAKSLAGQAVGTDPGPHPLRSMGGSIRIDLEGRRTVFQVAVPPERVVDAIEWQSDVMTSPRFSDSAIAHAIDLLRAERASAMNHPANLVVERLVAVAYGDHPAGRGHGIDPGVAGDLDTAVLEAFFDAHYTPSNLSLVVIGPFVREQMLEEIVRTFGTLAAAEPEDADPADAEPEPADDESPVAPDSAGEPEMEPEISVPAGLRYDWERGVFGRTHFGVAFRVPEASVAGTRERYVLETVLALVADGRASRLNTFVRDEQGVIDHAEASFLELGTAADPELLAVLTVAAADVDAAELSLFTELERIRRFGVNDEEVARARLRAAQRHYERRQTVSGLAADLARREFHGDWKIGERYPAGIAEVTSDDVQSFVRDYFRRDNLAVFELLPGDSSRALGSDDFVAEILDRVPPQMVARSVEELDVRVQVPIPGEDLVMDVIEPMNRFGILRGPDVYIVEDHRAPLVSFGLFFPGGRVLESSANAGITEFMLQTALLGTRRFNATGIARRIENAGARIEVVNEADYFGYVLDGFSGDIAGALDVLMEIWQEPSFLEGDVEAARRLLRARILDGIERAPARAFRRLAGTVFAGDPYSIPRTGVPESLDAIDSEALETWHFEHARAVMPLIVVAGDVNGSGIVSTIATTITNEDLFDRDIASLPAPEGIDIVPDFDAAEDGSYGVVAYGGKAGPFSSADHLPLTLVGDLLTGAGGRLPRAFAEAGIPATGRVGGSFMARAGMLHALVSFVAGDGVEAGAIREILDAEFERLAAEGIDADEIGSAAAHSDLLHRMEIEGRRGRVDRVARALLSGGGTESVDAFQDLVRSLEPEDIREAVARFVSGGDPQMIEVLGR